MEKKNVMLFLIGKLLKTEVFRSSHVILTVCILFSSPVLFAQTKPAAAEIDAVLKDPAISCAQAAAFILAAANIVYPENTAFEHALVRGWFPKNTIPNDPVQLGRMSFLIIEAFNIKGGFMYAIFPGPRYAFRTMVSRSYIRGAADPAMSVSGERFLLILGNVLNAVGDDL